MKVFLKRQLATPMNKTINHTLKALCLSVCLLGARGASADIINVSGGIAADTTWRSTNEYVLNGFVYVLNGASLTMDGGWTAR